jgi:hypothetical protein
MSRKAVVQKLVRRQASSPRGEGGQVLILYALILGLVGVAIVGMVADMAVLEFRNSSADSAAYLGAQAGAGDINQADFYAGALALAGQSGDSCTVYSGGSESGTCTGSGGDTAAGLCAGVAVEDDAGPNVMATCTQTGISLTLSVKQTVPLPIAVFGVTGSVRSTRTAGATFGTNKYFPIPQSQ